MPLVEHDTTERYLRPGTGPGTQETRIRDLGRLGATCGSPRASEVSTTSPSQTMIRSGWGLCPASLAMWPVILRSAVTTWCSGFSANDETVASGAAGRGAARGHYGEPKLENPERASPGWLLPRHPCLLPFAPSEHLQRGHWCR